MITIVLPISRRDYLKPVFDCLTALERPKDTELLVITDGDEHLERAVQRRLTALDYKRIQIVHFGDTPAEDIDNRRYRVAAIHNKAKHFVDPTSEYVMLIEDDTVYPRDALLKFLDAFSNKDYDHLLFACVSGLQLGRHGPPYIGAWLADNVGSPIEIRSIIAPPNPGWMYYVDAAGFYCCLIKTGHYVSHHFEPYDTRGTNGLSCDVNFGLWLRKRNYHVMVTDVLCDHIGSKGSVNLGNTKPVQVSFDRDLNGKWFAKVV